MFSRSPSARYSVLYDILHCRDQNMFTPWHLHWEISQTWDGCKFGFWENQCISLSHFPTSETFLLNPWVLLKKIVTTRSPFLFCFLQSAYMIAENLHSRTHVAIRGLVIFGKGVGHILCWQHGNVAKLCVCVCVCVVSDIVVTTTWNKRHIIHSCNQTWAPHCPHIVTLPMMIN
jgi:hypothetical protein